MAAIAVAATLGGPWLGIPVAAVLIGLGVRASYRWLRRALGAPAPGDRDSAGAGDASGPTR